MNEIRDAEKPGRNHPRYGQPSWQQPPQQARGLAMNNDDDRMLAGYLGCLGAATAYGMDPEGVTNWVKGFGEGVSGIANGAANGIAKGFDPNTYNNLSNTLGGWRNTVLDNLHTGVKDVGHFFNDTMPNHVNNLGQNMKHDLHNAGNTLHEKLIDNKALEWTGIALLIAAAVFYSLKMAYDHHQKFHKDVAPGAKIQQNNQNNEALELKTFNQNNVDVDVELDTPEQKQPGKSRRGRDNSLNGTEMQPLRDYREVERENKGREDRLIVESNASPQAPVSGNRVVSSSDPLEEFDASEFVANNLPQQQENASPNRESKDPELHDDEPENDNIVDEVLAELDEEEEAYSGGPRFRGGFGSVNE